ncbi:MAG: TolC family protein [Acidobacteria bacterium]|nr:TolC family protein [Acidobacteriota bacterium]
MTQRPVLLLALLFASGSSATTMARSGSPAPLSQTQETPPGQSVQTPPAQETPGAPRLTLEDAIQSALAQHPILRQARQSIAAAEARTKQAKSAYYPQVSVSGFAKQGLSGASGALGLRGLVTSPLFRDIGASSAVFQNLYDFGRTAHQVKASRWAVASLNHALEAVRAFVVLDVQQAYYSVLQQQRLVKVAEKILTDRQLIARQAAAFYTAQIRSKVDLSLAEAGVSDANLELVVARDRLRTASAELHRAMGADGAPDYTLEEPRIAVEPPAPIETLLAGSQQQRPDLLALDMQIRADAEFVGRARSSRWPRLMALFSSGWVRFSELSPGNLLLGAFGIDLPIFTGGRIEAEIQEAEANLGRTRAGRDTLAQDIRFQVQRAHNELTSAIEAIRANEQLIVQARQALRLAQVRYRVNIGSFVELSAAEAASSSAEAQYAQASYRYKIAEATLQFTAGQTPAP